jgi:hypothetical protein
MIHKKLILALLVVTLLAATVRAETIIVPSGGDFQAALNVAKPGDTIVLQAGAEYVVGSYSASFVLPAKTGTGIVTIRSSEADLLPADKRVSPADKSHMSRIVALGYGGAITAQPNAANYTFIGIEVTNRSSGTANEHAYTLVDIGNYVSGVANIWFDRCYVHPQEDGTTDYTRTSTRGFGINNVKNFKLTNSYVSGFMGEYQHDPTSEIDSEAFASNNGDGYLLENNYLGAYFNIIFLGGGGTDTKNLGVVQSTPAPTLTSATLSTVANLNVGDYVSFPQPVGANANGRVLAISGTSITFTSLDKFDRDCSCRVTPAPPVVGTSARWNGDVIRNAIIRRNTFDIDTVNAQREFDNFNKRMPKGFLEVKHCISCVFEANVFQGWPSGLAFNAVNQNGDSPWTTVKDLTVRNNLFRNFWTALLMSMGNPEGKALWHMTAEGENITVENNLFVQANNLPSDWGATRVAIWGYGRNVRMVHNTLINNGTTTPNTYMFASNGPITGFVFKDNIAFSNYYGMNCGLGAFNVCYPGWSEAKNVIVNNSNDVNSAVQAIFPNSSVASSLAALGFTDPSVGNYRLLATSPYHNTAGDGTDPGVNQDLLEAALGGAVVSIPTPSPMPSPTPTPTLTPTPTPSPIATPSPVPTPVPSPSPTTCNMVVNSPTVPQWSAGKLVASFDNLSGGPFTVKAVAVSGQVTVDTAPKLVSGTSVIAEFWLQAKKKSSSITVSGPCGSKTVLVNVQ